MGDFEEGCSTGSLVSRTVVVGIDVMRVRQLVSCTVEATGIGPSVTGNRIRCRPFYHIIDVGLSVGVAGDDADIGDGLGCSEGD